MKFHQTADGKNIYLSINSRHSPHNPLYKAWKAKSFTDGDIVLHFLLFDILSSPNAFLSLNEIMEELDSKLTEFDSSRTFDSSTVRKKLNEYVNEGLVMVKKDGRALLYSRTDSIFADCTDALDFFSEIAPCGVIGSFLLDKGKAHDSPFSFKHHYITSSLDSAILCTLFDCIHKKEFISIDIVSKHKKCKTFSHVVPLRIYISVQNGRQYLLAAETTSRDIIPFRLDNVLTIHRGSPCANYDKYKARLTQLEKHLWGVSIPNTRSGLKHVEFTVRYDASHSIFTAV